MDITTERRTHERHEFSATAFIRFENGSCIDAKLKDVSASGALVEFEETEIPSCPLKIRFLLLGWSEVVEFDASIAWKASSGKHTRCGVYFEGGANPLFSEYCEKIPSFKEHRII